MNGLRCRRLCEEIISLLSVMCWRGGRIVLHVLIEKKLHHCLTVWKLVEIKASIFLQFMFFGRQMGYSALYYKPSVRLTSGGLQFDKMNKLDTNMSKISNLHRKNCFIQAYQYGASSVVAD